MIYHDKTLYNSGFEWSVYSARYGLGNLVLRLRLIVAADGYDRVFVKKVIDTHFAVNDSGHTNNLKIGLLTRNDVFANEDFESNVNEYKLKDGSTVSGIVDDSCHWINH